MKNYLKSLALSIALIPAMASSAADGIEIFNQGSNSAIVRISADSRYILLPVQESAPQSEVAILKNGEIDRKFNINLSTNKIDYFVPLEISQYAGQQLLLDVRTDTNRSNVREMSDAIWSHELRLSDTFDTTNREKFRPAFHHTPAYGWMNDPNGMFYADGLWHLYYQYNPYGSKWQNMSWGHSTSRDLVNWEHQPTVLEPNGLGMIFSGSAVVDHNNTAGFGRDAIVALYTSADAIQAQSLAYSTDNGQSFTNYAGNPVIIYNRESRDPNMFWDEDHNRWVLVLASALDREMLIFTSPNLKEWTLQSSFGKGYGCQEGVWECPDLMRLPIEGTNKYKWVMICNINPGGPMGGSATQYFVGDFDGTTFTCDDALNVEKWMDYGKDHYATVSFSNAPENRHTVVAWMSNWQYANDVPTLQYRSTNSIARDLSLFRAADGELYLASRPVPEMEAIRGHAASYKNTAIDATATRFALPAENDGICEIVATIDLKSASTATLTLSNDLGEEVVMTINAADDTFAMDRTHSGIVDFSEHFPAVTVAPAHNGGKTYTVRLFIDKCSIEAFDAQGRFAMTNLVFPNSPYNTLSITATGKAKLNSLNIFPLIPEK